MLIALNREYTVAEFVTTVTHPNLRKALTMYRPSEHSLAIEKSCRRQTWLSREDRLYAHCPQNEVETELHFLPSCQVYDHIRDTYFLQVIQIHKEFKNKPNFVKLPYLLGEIPVCHHSSKICDLLPQEKECIFPFVLQLFAHHCNTVYRHNMTFEIYLLFWNFCECNVYCSFLLFSSLLFINYFTCFGNVNICFPC